VHRDLKDSTHVFLRLDNARRALQPHHSGPHKVIARTEKTFKIIVWGRHVTVPTDRLKSAYTLKEGQHGTRPISCPEYTSFTYEDNAFSSSPLASPAETDFSRRRGVMVDHHMLRCSPSSQKIPYQKQPLTGPNN
jgi:hypothetical protein